MEDYTKQKINYTAAESFPTKVIADRDLAESIDVNRIIPPIHLQLSPTNRCNLNCPFCSCSQVDRKQQLTIDELKEIANISASLGTKAVTITGGGEPLLHPEINTLIDVFHDLGVQIGLVSNGKAAKKLQGSSIDKITWIRVSFDDYREFNDEFISNMNHLVTSGHTDMAFSYVVSANVNLSGVEKIMNYANLNDFTHVRFVSDIYFPNEESINTITQHFKVNKINDDRAIYQARSKFTKGQKDCFVSLLKPIIAADGYIYPCCGVQYALAENKDQKQFPECMRMGHYSELPKIINATQNFDGSMCVKCYYKNYNDVLSLLMGDLKHKEFV